MNAGVRSHAKKAMRGKTGKLFLISLLVSLMRWIFYAACVLILYAFTLPEAQSFFVTLSPSPAVPILFYIGGGVLMLFFLQTAAGLRLGETEYYGIEAGGGCAKISVLFSHCAPFEALRALTLFMTILLFKAVWLVLMLAPCGAVTMILLMMYYGDGMLKSVFLILSVSAGLLFCIAVCGWYAYVQKYVFAPLLAAKSREFSPRNVLRRSTAIFDGCALRPAALKVGFLLSVLSCALIIPIFYVLPYIRMCMVSLYIESKKNVRLITEKAEGKPVVLHTKRV